MTFSISKQDSGPSPKIDVTQIRVNFATYSTVFSVNHKPMTGSANKQGDHDAVILERQTGDPGVQEDLCVLYNKNAPSKAGLSPQLFVQIAKFLPNEFDPENAFNQGMQLTCNSVNTAGPVYQSFIAGGYLIYFGSTNDITADIVLSPAPTKILVAIATPNNFTSPGTPIAYDVSTQINTSTNDRFKINSNLNYSGPSNPYTFGWFAIAVS